MEFFKVIKEKWEGVKDKKTLMTVAGIVLIVGLVVGNLARPSCSLDHEKTISDLKSDIESINEVNKTEIESKDKDIESLNAKVEDASPWFKMGEEQQRKIEEENARIESEKAAKEEQERQEQERLEQEKEKQGYNTGITYDQISRDEHEYWYKNVTFEGKVLQVQEGSSENTIRLAVNGNYDKVLLVRHLSPRVGNRIIDNDYITVRGIFNGLESYTSVLGAEITLPCIIAEDKNIDR